jgi:uncharacterized protein YndB with AHSA1/START domain
MTAATQTAVTTQVYRVYIKATPQAIWDAITDSAWTERYGYGAITVWGSGLEPGSRYEGRASDAMKAGGEAMGMPVPDVVVDGEVIEADPPRRLVQTWRMLMDPGLAQEGFTKLTYEIAEGAGGISRLTVTHELEGAPNLAMLVSGGSEPEEQVGAGGLGGWNWVLSDLKSLLETGAPLLTWEGPQAQA